MTLRFRRRITLIIALAWTAVCGAVLSLAGVYLYLNPQIPSAEEYRHVALETPLRVYAADGSLMAVFGERRVIPVTLTEVPPMFIRAVLDTEDKRFYSHSGIDFISLVNDTLALAWNREITSGASTITMQLARNISFTLEQTFIRKFKEMLLALKVEQELTKDEILELYLNVIPFGKRAYGAQAAAVTYYGKPLAELNLAQFAMLAGIPQAPSAGNPINGPERALKRRNVILGLMLSQGSITEAEYQQAIDAPITAAVHQRELEVAAPYAAEWVRRQLLDEYGREIYTGGFEADTTIDASMQRIANHALQEGLLAYDRRHGYRGHQGHIELPAALRDAVLPIAGVPAKPPADEDVAAATDALVVDDVTATADWPVDPNVASAVAEVIALLRELPPTGGLEPALVIRATSESFSALRATGEAIEVPYDNVKWARRYIDSNTEGAAVTKVTDVVDPGDIVYVRLAPKFGWALSQPPEIQGALVALEPHTGAVKALVGGFDFASNQFDHALQARRQPGSGFKPFVYSAALDHGVTAASMFLDAPLVFQDATLEDTYRPKNSGGTYNGPTRLREALYRSINLVSMRVLLEVGAENVLDYVQRFGFPTENFPHNTQLAIGGGTIGITPLEMARAYAVFANGGYLVEPNILTEVRSQDGEVILRPRYPIACKPCEEELAAAAGQSTDTRETDPLVDEPARMEDLLADGDTPAAANVTDEAAPLLAPRVIDERNAFIIHSMLQDVIRRGTGASAARALERLDIAGKTGTTNEADTWFNGYHENLVATVWIGFSDNRPVGDREFGSNLPLPVWIELMSHVLPKAIAPNRAQPAGVLTLKIDPHTGRRAAPDQPDAIFEYFVAEHTPPEEVVQPTLQDQIDTTTIRTTDIF